MSKNNKNNKNIENIEMIKIHIEAPEIEVDEEGLKLGGETVWAIERGIGKAEIDNIPFFSNIGFKDIIRYKNIDGINTYIETIVSKTKTIGVQWDPTDKEDKNKVHEEWIKICKYLDSKKLDFESSHAGIFVIAYPIETDIEDIFDIIDDSPIELDIGWISGEEDD